MTLLILCAPLLGAAALAIWIEDGRPVLFSQSRAGRNGEKFEIWKLRTLETDHDAPTRPSEHATGVGALLRHLAVDELPQLWNVLHGDMSLVGPRPPLPSQIEKYTARESRRLDVRPGLTGWAQIHGRNALPWSERIDLDLWYVQNQTVALDLYILLRTPFLLISGRGINGPDGQNPRLRQRASDSPSS